MKLTIKTCLRCRWSWPTKQDHPKVCPKCKSPYWNTPRLEKKLQGEGGVR